LKELGDMNRGFAKRRAKVADAEVRQLARQRKEELEQVREALGQ